ncbi:TPA: hypothetical protein ACX6QP_002500 [Photobacterium damselae]
MSSENGAFWGEKGPTAYFPSLSVVKGAESHSVILLQLGGLIVDFLTRFHFSPFFHSKGHFDDFCARSLFEHVLQQRQLLPVVDVSEMLAEGQSKTDVIASE